MNDLILVAMAAVFVCFMVCFVLRLSSAFEGKWLADLYRTDQAEFARHYHDASLAGKCSACELIGPERVRAAMERHPSEDAEWYGLIVDGVCRGCEIRKRA